MGTYKRFGSASSSRRRQSSISVAPVFHIVSQKAITYFVTSAEVSHNCLGCLYSPIL